MRPIPEHLREHGEALQPQQPDDPDRILPEHVAMACLVITAVAVGIGALGSEAGWW